MEAHQPRLLPRRMERRNVGVPEQRLRLHLRQHRLHPWQQPRGAVPATDAPDAVHAVVGEGLDQVVATLGIVTSEIAVPRQGMWSNADRPPERLRRGHGPLEFVRAEERP